MRWLRSPPCHDFTYRHRLANRCDDTAGQQDCQRQGEQGGNGDEEDDLAEAAFIACQRGRGSTVKAGDDAIFQFQQGADDGVAMAVEARADDFHRTFGIPNQSSLDHLRLHSLVFAARALVLGKQAAHRRVGGLCIELRLHLGEAAAKVSEAALKLLKFLTVTGQYQAQGEDAHAQELLIQIDEKLQFGNPDLLDLNRLAAHAAHRIQGQGAEHHDDQSQRREPCR